jgi:hypothetical protein
MVVFFFNLKICVFRCPVFAGLEQNLDRRPELKEKPNPEEIVTVQSHNTAVQILSLSEFCVLGSVYILQGTEYIALYSKTQSNQLMVALSRTESLVFPNIIPMFRSSWT